LVPAQIVVAGRLTGDIGARTLLDGPLIECGDAGSDLDVDTTADLDAVRRATSRS
jgi:CTP:molybdopterin cytidylyltransferase MocA